jgi:hypothetical protein
MRSTFLTLCCLAALGAIAPLWGQPGGDISGYAGFYHESGATKAILGGTAAKFVGRRTELVGDLGYVPFGYGANMITVTGGVDVMLTNPRREVVPYIPLRVGFARYWQNWYSDNSPIFGGGLGVRCRLGRNWGVRPEVQYIRFQKSEAGFNAMRMTFGLYYEFGE